MVVAADSNLIPHHNSHRVAIPPASSRSFLEWRLIFHSLKNACGIICTLLRALTVNRAARTLFPHPELPVLSRHPDTLPAGKRFLLQNNGSALI